MYRRLIFLTLNQNAQILMMLPTLISVETVHEGDCRGKLPAPVKRARGRQKSVAAVPALSALGAAGEGCRASPRGPLPFRGWDF